MLGGAEGHKDPCSHLKLQHWQKACGAPGWTPSFQDLLPLPPSLGFLGLPGSLLAELNEGLSLFVPLPGLQQLEDLICWREGQ